MVALSALALPFAADWRVGFSDDAVLMTENYGEDVHLYSPRHGERWKRPLPPGITWNCWKAMDARRDELLLCEDSVTVVLDSTGKEKQRFTRPGRLLSCLTTSQRVYVVEDENGGHFHLEIAGDAGETQDKLYSPGKEWSKWLSVCDSAGRLAVTDNETETLTIFTSNSKSHRKTQKLSPVILYF